MIIIIKPCVPIMAVGPAAARNDERIGRGATAGAM